MLQCPAMKKASNGRALPVMYNCSKCPGYCCTYKTIDVTKRDIARLAKHFGVTYDHAKTRYTKVVYGNLSLRHQKDHIFKRACMFFDTDKRRCTVYEARPTVCRQYPESKRCGYYDFLASERRRQCDDEFIPDA
jgi:Fe-S-cluster containining protein